MNQANCPVSPEGWNIITALRELSLIDRDEDALHECQWSGVACTDDGILHGITCYAKDASNCSIQWLPQTIRNLDMRGVSFSIRNLDTRRLPRECQFCAFEMGDIRGTIELRTLPNDLQILNLEENRISGTVHLTWLPASMRRMSMARNRIKKAIVSNSLLPLELSVVDMYQPFDLVRVVCLDSEAVDKRVRVGLQMIRFKDALDDLDAEDEMGEGIL